MDFKYEQRSVSGLEFVDNDDFEYNLEGCECNDKCSFLKGCKCLSYGTDNYDSNGLLLHEEDSNVPILECNPNCSCSADCGNRVAQLSLQIRVEPFDTPNKGLGLRTLEEIKRGRFVIEYNGEIISREEAAKRAEKPNQNNYILTLYEFSGQESCCRTYIDARNFASLSRFINHSCDPNLYRVILRYGRIIPVLALFAKRDISQGEELNYDYGEIPFTNQISTVSMKECRCGSLKCRKFLPCCDYSVV